MRGELLPIWSDMYREVWAKLARNAPADLFCELFRELNQARKSPLDINTLADVIDSPVQARVPSAKSRVTLSTARESLSALSSVLLQSAKTLAELH